MGGTLWEACQPSSAWEAVDCTDEKINPGIRNVTEQLAGEKAGIS